MHNPPKDVRAPWSAGKTFLALSVGTLALLGGGIAWVVVEYKESWSQSHFLSDVNDRLPDTGLSGDRLLDAGEAACRKVEGGADWSDVQKEVPAGTSPKEAAAIYAAARIHLCKDAG
ncbi:DUF732 domain-containing protein [Streptomyces sp. NBC_01304]|uniref:DUF732 domain-containing protein n=1 Tax=Streptomyces sp. NBC_01304 TaxID=2903818 RepID=UPI002E10CA05|nr:DUF732 domain-containing protein [Streptomyces sp. NBC_01304]